MTVVSWVLLTLGVIAAVIDWRAVQIRNERVEQLAKPAVMVFLLAAALGSDLSGWPLVWLVTALAFGLIGDILLLPVLDRFVPALAAFLVGHLAYSALALVSGIQSGWLVVGLVLASGVVFTVGSKIADAVHGSSYFAPVVAYIVVIALTTSLLIGSGRWVLMAGALLFAVSDSLLGWDRFIDDTPGGRVAVHATYHLAQTAIVLGAVAV